MINSTMWLKNNPSVPFITLYSQLSTLTQSELKLHLSTEVDIT